MELMESRYQIQFKRMFILFFSLSAGYDPKGSKMQRPFSSLKGSCSQVVWVHVVKKNVMLILRVVAATATKLSCIVVSLTIYQISGFLSIHRNTV